MATPNFQNQFNPYADWQAYAPTALGTPSQGFIPLNQANYGGTAEFQDVMAPKTDWYNHLADLEGLPANMANWAGGEAGGGWGTGLLNDIQLGSFYGGDANPALGDAGWQWNWGGLEGTGGTFGDYGYEPSWDLQTRLTDEGIAPWAVGDQGVADPNYDPSSLGIDTEGSYNPSFATHSGTPITPTHDLFQSDDQFDYSDQVMHHRNYVPGLRQALGTGSDLSGFGSDYANQVETLAGYKPSYLETGRESEWDAFKLPAGQGGSPGQFGYNAEPFMLAANPTSGMGGDASNNMRDLQQAFNYNALQNAGVESGLSESDAAGNPQLALNQMVTNAALGNPWGATADEYKQALAWNRLPRDADWNYPGHKAMYPGWDIGSSQNKAALKNYIAAETPYFSDYGRDTAATAVLDNIEDFTSQNITPSDVGYIDPTSVQSAEQQAIKDWQSNNIWGDNELNPTKLKNPNISGSVGDMEREAIRRVQSAWNDPTNANSLQSRELASRKLAQEAEMAGMKNFQDYRTDNVIGTALNPGTLYGDVDIAQEKLMADSAKIQDAYQGVGGKRPTEIGEYDDYVWDKLQGSSPTSWTPMRDAKIDLYNEAILGGGGTAGLQNTMQGQIDAIHEEYLASPGGAQMQQMNTPDGSSNFTGSDAGGTTKEGQKLEEFANKYQGTTDTYAQGLRDLEDQYWLEGAEKEDKKKELIKDASQDWRKSKRDLDLQMQEGGSETSKLRRDIRGFKGGNILSGRRNRRAEEEYGKAMMDRADLMRQQKDITDERRSAQKKARSDYDREMDVLDETTQTEATNLFDDSALDLSNKAASVATDLSNYQTDIQNKVYSDSGSPIKSSYSLKQGMEEGPGSTTSDLEGQYQTFKGDMTGQTDPNNFMDTLGDIQDWKAKAMGEGFEGKSGYYGTGGIRDTYQDSVNTAQGLAEQAEDDAFSHGAKSLEDISADRTSYASDTAGNIGKFNTIRDTDRENLHTKYMDYTDSMDSGWGQTLVDTYGGGDGLISAVAGSGGTGRSGLMERYMSNESPWYDSSDNPGTWAPDVLWSGNSLADSGKGMKSRYVNPQRNLFGRDFNTLTAMNNTGNDYRGFHNWTIRSGAGMPYGLGRSDKVGGVNPTKYWAINGWNHLNEVPYLQSTTSSQVGQAPMNWDFSTAKAAIHR